MIFTFVCKINLIIFGYLDVFYMSNTSQLEYFNDFLILICVYHQFLFTDFVSDPEIQYQIGFSFIASAAFACLINYGLSFISSILSLIYKLKVIR